MSAQISNELRSLLRERLTSIDQIDIVLLLMNDPSRSWTASEVATALRSAPEAAAMRLFLLASGGFLTFEAAGTPRYRYGVADEQHDRLLRELAAACAEDRNAVLDVVDAAAHDPIRSFADAFRLKK